ncbi:MAG TPA: hypothetical protein VNL71_18375 [Chloroflexota bacterium]|nr:hypothetical protein [Chloroflexota bacterium]
MSRKLAAIIGGLALGLAAAAAPATAASHTMTMALHGAKLAHMAMASVKITMISNGDYRIQVDAAGLPAPTSLKVKPRRSVYLVWVIDGKHKNSAMAVLALKRNPANGHYTTNGVVMIQEVTEISVTADLSAKQHMPTMPMVEVLSSGHGLM